MSDVDWNAQAELWKLEGPPVPGSPRTQVASGTLAECISLVIRHEPQLRRDFAISTASQPLLRVTDIELLAKRSDFKDH